MSRPSPSSPELSCDEAARSSSCSSHSRWYSPRAAVRRVTAGTAARGEYQRECEEHEDERAASSHDSSGLLGLGRLIPYFALAAVDRRPSTVDCWVAERGVHRGAPQQ